MSSLKLASWHSQECSKESSLFGWDYVLRTRFSCCACIRVATQSRTACHVSAAVRTEAVAGASVGLAGWDLTSQDLKIAPVPLQVSHGCSLILQIRMGHYALRLLCGVLPVAFRSAEVANGHDCAESRSGLCADAAVRMRRGCTGIGAVCRRALVSAASLGSILPAWAGQHSDRREADLAPAVDAVRHRSLRPRGPQVVPVLPASSTAAASRS